MIGLKTAAGWLDLQPGTIGIEISNPFFQYDAVPGVTTYPFGLPRTSLNVRLLNFPHVRAAQGELVAPEPVEFYVDGQLWRTGSLVYQDYQADKQVLQYKFAAAADELATRIEGLTLPDLDLGAVPLLPDPAQPDYALCTLLNTAFYGDALPSFQGWVNEYNGGYGAGLLCPQLRLVPLLRKVLQSVGYTLKGALLTDVDVAKLILYTDRAAENAAGSRLPTLTLRDYVPPMGVGEALIALQKLLAWGFSFDPIRREVRVVRLCDVAEDDAYLVREAGQLTRSVPSGYQGYALELSLESGDERLKTLDTSWTKLVVGPGKTEIKSDAGTLPCVQENGRVLPVLQVKGASPAYELGAASRCGLRLLFDHGMVNGYPTADNGHVLGGLDLRWEGERGLYQQLHKPWLDLLARAASEERTMPFRVADLLALDPARKEMVGPHKYLWEKVSVSVSTSTRLQSARFTYRHVRR